MMAGQVLLSRHKLLDLTWIENMRPHERGAITVPLWCPAIKFDLHRTQIAVNAEGSGAGSLLGRPMFESWVDITRVATGSGHVNHTDLQLWTIGHAKLNIPSSSSDQQWSTPWSCIEHEEAYCLRNTGPAL